MLAYATATAFFGLLLCRMAAAAEPFAVQAAVVDDIAPASLLTDSIWSRAPRSAITWNVDFHRPAQNLTDVRMLFSRRYLYVLFDAAQREPLTATQTSDGSGVDDDDHIGLYVWPSGANGFRYFFEANPLGARYQESSENQNFSPDWIAAGTRTSRGYRVAVRIPLKVLRGDGRSTWRLQLDRYVSATQEQNVWAFAPDQRNETQVSYAGYLTGMSFASQETRAHARLAPYALTRIGSSAANGSTVTAGLDLAVPITQRLSLVGTVHPDYSNVELNQQTISPTVFPRTYLEVRPFFVQGASLYNQVSSIYDFQLSSSAVLSQPFTLMLYTPSIPTPSSGFALEGYQGNLGIAAFDSLGYGRDDNAQSFTYANDRQTVSAALQRVSVNYPGFSNTVVGGGITLDDQRTGYAYATFASDRGTGVLNASQAQWEEIGAAYRRPNLLLGIALRSIGRYYLPADGYVANTDVAGYDLVGHRFFSFSRTAPLLSLSLDATVDKYHGTIGGINQVDNALQATLTTRNLFSVTGIAGSHALYIPGQGLLPFNQNGIGVGYLDGTATPTDVTFQGGRYGRGYLDSILSSVNLPLFEHKTTLTIAAQGTDYRAASSPAVVQWLENAAVNWQITRRSSLSFGVRKIVGTAPTYPFLTQDVRATNVSAAFHYLQPYGELYAAYGNPNDIATFPAAIVKYIFYFGATKGT
jgi:hypothetical protein